MFISNKNPHVLIKYEIYIYIEIYRHVIELKIKILYWINKSKLFIQLALQVKIEQTSFEFKKVHKNGMFSNIQLCSLVFKHTL